MIHVQAVLLICYFGCLAWLFGWPPQNKLFKVGLGAFATACALSYFYVLLKL